MRTFLACVLLLAAAGCCDTGYQSSAGHLAGGYSDHQIDTNTFRVSFRGNGFTSEDEVQDYLLRRCAEVTRKAGFDYFEIIDGGSAVDTSYIVTRNQWGGTANAVNKPRSSVIIKCHMGFPPASDRNAYDARNILAHAGR